MDDSTLRWLVDIARPERARLVFAVLLGAAAAAAAVALMGTSAYLISRASQQPPILTLTAVIVSVRFFGISRGVARYAERLVGHDAAFRVVSDLRVEVYRRIEPLVPARMGGRSSGDVLTRFAADVDAVSDAYLRVFPAFAIATIVGGGSVVVLVLIDPWVGLILAVGLLVSAWTTSRVVSSSVTQSQRELAGGRAEYVDQVLDMLEVLPETWVADTTQPVVGRVTEARARLLLAELRVARGSGLGEGLGRVIAGVTVVACLVVGAVGVTDGSIDGVMLAVLVLTPMAAFDLVTPLPEAVRRWSGVRESSDRIRELLHADSPAATENGVAIPSSRHAESGALELHSAVVRWPEGADASLHEVSLQVRSGGRVAVVGHSGAGKSTLALTLAGFLPIEDGSLRVGGYEAGLLSELEWHATVGLLEQRPYVFDTSVGENLLLARPGAAEADLAGVLERVGLGAWLRTLPAGLDTRVGEHGHRLSGGQRQRLGLARLLLANHPVLVLDEPDEHLDTPSADALMADLLQAASDRTVVVISHRLSPLVGVDQIYVLEEGRVVESGSHGTLLARGGWYARTWMHEREVAELSEAAREATTAR